MDTKETSYSQMVTVTRLNYRSDCNFTAGTIVGVLEDNTPVKVADDFMNFITVTTGEKSSLVASIIMLLLIGLKRFKSNSSGQSARSCILY